MSFLILRSHYLLFCSLPDEERRSCWVSARVPANGRHLCEAMETLLRMEARGPNRGAEHFMRIGSLAARVQTQQRGHHGTTTAALLSKGLALRRRWGGIDVTYVCKTESYVGTAGWKTLIWNFITGKCTSSAHSSQAGVGAAGTVSTATESFKTIIHNSRILRKLTHLQLLINITTFPQQLGGTDSHNGPSSALFAALNWTTL